MRKFLLLSVIFMVTLAFSANAQTTETKPAPAAEKPAATPPAEPFIPSVTNVIGEPHNWGWDFQKGFNELGTKIYHFHIFINSLISIISAVVLGLIAFIVFRFRASKNPVPSKTTHNMLLEIIWTVIPIIIVIIIIIPSMKLLYYVDRTEKADLTLKVVGYQWYWGYELPDQKVPEFESRLIPEEKLQPGQKKMIEVDEPLLLPIGKTVRVLVTADPLGVVHAWGINSLSFKRDAMPGRVNEGWLRIEKPGIYYGQCYELCGVDHAYMPIKVIGVPEEEFNRWVISKGGEVTDNNSGIIVQGGNNQGENFKGGSNTKDEVVKVKGSSDKNPVVTGNPTTSGKATPNNSSDSSPNRSTASPDEAEKAEGKPTQGER